MKIMRAALLVVALGLVGTIVASCGQSRASSGGSVNDAIRAHFGDQEAKAHQVVECESGHNPNAYNPNGGYYGLFQISRHWHEGTFEGMGYDWDRDIWDPYANAHIARVIYNRSGGWGPWSCA